MEHDKKAKHAKHGFTHTHIEHHHDGSATVHHVHHMGPEHDVKHAVSNLDAMHDSMQDHLGQPNPGEAEANAGPAAMPMAGMPPAGA
jgi:hypothetical protein